MGMKLGLLLIALAMGYRVYADASKEKGFLRSLGLLVGAFVMAVSLLASAIFISHYCGGRGHCPFSKMKGEEHHFTVQVQPNPAVKT